MAKVTAACLQVFTINTQNRKKDGDKFYILIKQQLEHCSNSYFN